MSQSVPAVGQDELATLKLVALDGGLVGPVKISCAGLADRLDASNQTASRRLQGLEGAGYLERDVVSDGQWLTITDEGEAALHAEYIDYRRIFEERTPVTLRGVVTSGMGEGRHYISLPGYNKQFNERLEYDPYPGTLNLELDDESVRTRSGLQSLEGIPIDGWEDEERTFGPATCYPARVRRESDLDWSMESTADDPENAAVAESPGTTSNTNGQDPDDASAPDQAVTTYDDAHVIVPERTHHDERNLELIAPDKLREELGLIDGDELVVEIVSDADELGATVDPDEREVE